MRKKVELIILIVLLAGLIVLSRNIGKQVSGTALSQGKGTIIIDAGHGSGDPGKVGINQVLEKDVNLNIAKNLKTLLEKEDIQVVMTREDDSSLAGDADTNVKVQDMKARVKLINDTKPELVVSIHQNSYHEESIHGAQVFYFAHSKESEKAAGIMQEALLSIDPENTRKAKANETYYLLKRTEVTIIIVEAGFLSNQAEAEKLATEEYQEKVAEAVCAGVMEYLSGN